VSFHLEFPLLVTPQCTVARPKRLHLLTVNIRSDACGSAPIKVTPHYAPPKVLRVTSASQ